jgi:hypothetical protein
LYFSEGRSATASQAVCGTYDKRLEHIARVEPVGVCDRRVLLCGWRDDMRRSGSRGRWRAVRLRGVARGDDRVGQLTGCRDHDKRHIDAATHAFGQQTLDFRLVALFKPLFGVAVRHTDNELAILVGDEFRALKPRKRAAAAHAELDFTESGFPGFLWLH